MRTGLDVLDELDSSGESGRAVRGLAPGNVIEVYGESGSGKSELLLHVLMRTILPQAAGGQESGVVIFDNDMSLDILKLARRLGAALQAAAAAAAAEGTGGSRGTVGAAAGAGGGAAGAGSGQQPHPPHPPHVVPAPLDDDALEAAVVECLRRVHVYRCRSSLECLVTLHAVREVLVHDPVPVRALLFDSLAAFHFQDKAIEDQGGRMMRMHLARTVSSLVADHRLLVLGAKPAL
jgi:DNA-repair protein XRCC2